MDQEAVVGQVGQERVADLNSVLNTWHIRSAAASKVLACMDMYADARSHATQVEAVQLQNFTTGACAVIGAVVKVQRGTSVRWHPVLHDLSHPSSMGSVRANVKGHRTRTEALDVLRRAGKQWDGGHDLTAAGQVESWVQHVLQLPALA